MNFPKKVDILGTSYKVFLVSQEKMDKIIEGAMGGCDKDKKEIYVVNVSSEFERWRSFFHEFGHGLLCEASIDQGLPEEVEQIIVDLYSKQFVRAVFGKCEVKKK